MNNAIPRETRPNRTILHSNPILSRLSKVTERSTSNSATYTGIAIKTSYFLIVTVIGILAQLIVKAALAGEPVWETLTVYESFTVSLSLTETVIVGAVALFGFIAELIGIFARKTIPVTGTIYSASQGYVISFLLFKVLAGYEYLGFEAVLLTVAVVLVMSWLYSSGLVRGGKKFRTVLLSLILGTIGFGVLSFLGVLIPATRPFVQALLQNAALTLILDVVGLVIASLFLISDFSMIDTCVQEGYPKEYEWSAAFGLVFTVIWIYLKILDLLIQFTGKKKD